MTLPSTFMPSLRNGRVSITVVKGPKGRKGRAHLNATDIILARISLTVGLLSPKNRSARRSARGKPRVRKIEHTS
jgi:hypothetical protein